MQQMNVIWLASAKTEGPAIPFGCSTLSAVNEEGGYLFGRNFDWDFCDAMIVRSEPESGYASIATVNTDFIQAGGVSLSRLPDTIDQDTDKPDLTTTTAVRLLLNQAAEVWRWNM